jgi:release factor glutamine methyltransferase
VTSGRDGGALSSEASDAGVVRRLRAAGCVFAEEEAEILLASASSPEELDAMVRRRADGHPLEQVVGWADFCGLRVVVEPGVFVPRRRTTLMAREAVALAGRLARPPVVVDLCCGTGALGLAVVAGLEGAVLHAVDIDPLAVRCARRNLAGRGTVHRGDLDAPLPTGLQGRVDVLLANVPYVPTEEIALLPGEARLHEPAVALDGGRDGLRLLARVAALAPRWLSSSGSVLVETSERQVPAALAIVGGLGLWARTVTDEDLDATIVVAGLRGGTTAR